MESILERKEEIEKKIVERNYDNFIFDFNFHEVQTIQDLSRHNSICLEEIHRKRFLFRLHSIKLSARHRFGLWAPLLGSHPPLGESQYTMPDEIPSMKNITSTTFAQGKL